MEGGRRKQECSLSQLRTVYRLLLTWDMLEKQNRQPTQQLVNQNLQVMMCPDDTHAPESLRSTSLGVWSPPSLLRRYFCSLSQAPCPWTLSLLSALPKTTLFHLYSLRIHFPSSLKKYIQILIGNLKYTLMYISDFGI